MMDVESLVSTTREFIRAEVLPVDDEHDGDAGRTTWRDHAAGPGRHDRG
jgi:hypothetical protein